MDPWGVCGKTKIPAGLGKTRLAGYFSEIGSKFLKAAIIYVFKRIPQHMDGHASGIR